VWQGSAVGMKPEAILDTCVCIDLCNGGLLDALGLLPYHLVIPDVIATDELKPADLAGLLAGGAEVEIASETEVAKVATLAPPYPSLSTYDQFALAMAISRRAALLTSEMPLRKAAAKEGVTVIGTLGLLDKLETLLPASRLASALERILGANSFQPATECQARFRRWRHVI
jgi:predicted nucleic acid-binding protein